MRRVVNYHSSWARQQQVELFDASGNPGSTAGRGFNPASGAPGGELREISDLVKFQTWEDLSFRGNDRSELISAETAEYVRSGEDDNISAVEQPSKIIDKEEDSLKNKETDIQLVETETGKEIDPEPVEDVGQIPLDEESLSIDDLLKWIPEDMMLPSFTAAEPAKIKFGYGITIKGVADKVWYKASLPKIVVADKGKAPLVEPDTVKGHPAHEMVQLICGDIEFLVQLRENVRPRAHNRDKQRTNKRKLIKSG
ncbi:hypothetical protein F511_31683 [Dorcoceras hygrometricum]|uniref:Splicing factor 3B subunit 1-like n=1 Tax=Dorcoceras hygrometricum TaxID=472368 RepID=A0A2Z7BTL7_9LAMI|nr:hypothetical protein F511_31683 [Dorcoceras hygrometricum]